MSSIYTIREYVCKFYGCTIKEIESKSLEYRLVRARQMIILLTGKGRDASVSEIIKRYRCQIPVIRKTVLGHLEHDKSLRQEFERIKKGLLQYEIA